MYRSTVGICVREKKKYCRLHILDDRSLSTFIHSTIFFLFFLECLAGQMEINSLSTVPMYFVSPVANSSLAYSNIMAEWLSGTVYIFQECHKKIKKKLGQANEETVAKKKLSAEND